MRTMIAVMVVWVMGSYGASATLIDFQFNETGPVEITAAVDSGTAGESFDNIHSNGVVNGGSFTVTDNSVAGESVIVSGIGGPTAGTLVLATSVTYDFTGLANVDGIRFIMSDSGVAVANLQLITANAGAKHKVKYVGDATAATAGLLGSTGTIDLRMTADLGLGTLLAEYNEGAGWTTVYNGTTGMVDLDKLTITTDQWAGDLTGSAAVDYLTVNVIPEPATGGMLGLGALLALLSRRFRPHH